eukprot:CFRG2071T1
MSYYNPNDFNSNHYASGSMGGGMGGSFSEGRGAVVNGVGDMYSHSSASSNPTSSSTQATDLQFEDYSNQFGSAHSQNFGSRPATDTSMGMGSSNAFMGGDMYSGSMSLAPDESTGTFGFDNEPPLLEELEINFDQIKHKAAMALNPARPGETHLMDDTDLAGPLLFCFMFGGSLLLSGKVHFGIIYGVALIGCLALFALLNLMSDATKPVSLGLVCSVLGYCLLPMVVLSLVSALFDLQGIVGLGLVTTSVLWCTISSAKMFVYALAMSDQRLLVAYPCMLLYVHIRDLLFFDIVPLC